MVTNDAYLTACEVFRKRAESYTGKTGFVVLDNAKYQKGSITRALAEHLGIKVVFIPSYAPPLKLIEGLWKFAKGKLR
jgi:transposase